MRNHYFFLSASLIFCHLIWLIRGDLPPEIQKCNSKDNEKCIGKTIEDILRRYPTGNPDFGMPNVSAFNTTHLKVSRSSPVSPIQINFEFIKCTAYGLQNLMFLKTSGFDKELQNIEIILIAPNIKLKGDYEMMGKILLLPINGKGKGEIELKDVNMTVRFKTEKHVQSNHKTYLKVKQIKAFAFPNEMVSNFENLFDGNPLLSQTLNDVINENWKDVWLTLQDGINHAFAIIVQNIANEIYKVVTLEDMYLD